MIIHLDLEDDRPLYRQICDGIVRGIVAGEIAPDEQLPPGRQLAAALGVNLETVQRAYRELADDGIVVSRVGRGTRVSSSIDPAALGLTRDVDALVLKASRLGIDVNSLVVLIQQRAQV